MKPNDNPAPEPTSEPLPTQTAAASPGSSTVTPSPDSVASASPAPPTALPSQNSVNSSGNKKKSLIVLGAIIAAVLVLGGSAAAYFGVIVPNKPENLWKKSLQNTGKGYDNLVNYAEQKKDVKGGTLNGNFKIEAPGVVADGKITSKYYDKDSETKIDIGAVGTRFSLELLTTTAEGSKNPDVYAKVTGLKGLDQLLAAEAPGIGQQLGAFENQWFVVDHTFLDSLEQTLSQDPQTQAAANLKAEDVVALAKDMGEVTKEYVLTDDSSKAVLNRKQDVGKETVDGRSVYHYKVGLDKAHLKDFNKAACDKLINSNVYKAISNGKPGDDFKKECYDTKDIDKINESDTADVWVDTKTKVIRTVRITPEKEKKDNYFDLGLLYNGGDEYPFVIKFVTKEKGSEGQGELKFTLNTKTDKVSFDISADGKEANQPFKFSLKGAIVPGNNKVKITKPQGAKPLQEFLGGLVGNGLFPGPPTLPPTEPSSVN